MKSALEMKSLRIGIVVLSLAAGASPVAMAANAVNPDAVELTPIPRPAEMSLDMDRPVAFDRVELAVRNGEAASVKWLADHFQEWYKGNAPKVVAGDAGGVKLPDDDEAYAIEADAKGVRIAANTLKGVRLAAYSLRQVAIAKRGTFTSEGYIVPSLKIVDKPLLKFRGVHLCAIHPIRVTQLERCIRLAAMMKYNYVVLEPWGMYRSEKHPWWSWPKAILTKDVIRHLVAVAKDLGVTLIPQINVYGHGTCARSSTMKHAVLDMHPEYEPLFEPGGWNWCLTNPETQRVLRELITEMHEDFGNPPYFHIGCDEAQPPTCPECRKAPYGETVCRHISGLVDFLRSRGAKAMMWHDMLIEGRDPRWKGFVAMGSKATATLADTLPKDVVICDWQYSYGDMREFRKDWPTIGYFKEKGFPVCGCPWRNYNAMAPMADYIAKNGGFGFLLTTWHHVRGSDWRNMFVYGAAASWGTPAVDGVFQYDTPFALILRQAGIDTGVTDDIDTGIYDEEMPVSVGPQG